MKKTIILIVLLISFALCGCENTTEEVDVPATYCVLIGGTRMGSQLVLPTDISPIEKSFKTSGEISIISNDSVNDVYSLSVNPNQREKVVNRQIEKQNQLLNSILMLPVQNAEFDLYNSLLKASYILSEATDFERQLIITDSLISTTGYIEAKYIFDDPEAYIRYLDENEILVDLSNCTITIYGCGQTRDPQQSLSPQQIQELKSFYSKYFELCNAEKLTFIQGLQCENKAGELQYVTPVDVGNPPQYIKLDSTALFKQGSSEIIDSTALYNAIEQVKNDEISSVEVIITTSSEGSYAVNQEIAYQRLDTISQILTGSGISIGNTQIYIAEENPFFTQEYDENGVWNDELAQNNRAVYIVY